MVKKRVRKADSPPEARMGEILRELAADKPVEIKPHFRWDGWRGFEWESDFALIIGKRTTLIEVDGLAYHKSQKNFQRDRMKDRDAQFSGYSILRFTANEVTNGEAEGDVRDMMQAELGRAFLEAEAKKGVR